MKTAMLRNILGWSVLSAVASTASYAQSPSARLGKPDILIVAAGMPAAQQTMLTQTSRLFYEFWNTNDAQTLNAVISPNFIDRDLPAGRPQGPTGPSFANTQFRKAVPDLHCDVTQKIVVGDRVVSHLRFKGHFTGTFGEVHGIGQAVDFVATDILRIQSGKITDNWHIEDNLTFQQQIGIVRR